MFLIGNIPFGRGSLYEYLPAVLKAVEIIPSACHAPQVSFQSENKTLKINNQVEKIVFLCISLYFSPITATYLPFSEKHEFMFPLNPTQYLELFGGSLLQSSGFLLKHQALYVTLTVR